MSENWELALEALKSADAQTAAALFRVDAGARASRATNEAMDALARCSACASGMTQGSWAPDTG
jgi:hypothetical protein